MKMSNGIYIIGCNSSKLQYNLIYNVKYIFGEACIAVGNINSVDENGNINQKATR
jgi:hypothetical protein